MTCCHECWHREGVRFKVVPATILDSYENCPASCTVQIAEGIVTADDVVETLDDEELQCQRVFFRPSLSNTLS